MIFRPSRTRRGDDPWLRHRMLLFLLGGALCIVGLVLETGMLISIAIAILAIGAIVGLTSRRKADADRSVDEDSPSP